MLSYQYSLANDFKDWKIYFFLSPECPLCQSYTLEINNIQNHFSIYEFKFIGVYSTDYPVDTIKSFIEKYHLNLVLLHDVNRGVANKLKAKVTPQVIIVDDKDTIIYSGAIDNWAVSLGEKRGVITKRYLHENLNELIHYRKIKYSNNAPIGCIIQN